MKERMGQVIFKDRLCQLYNILTGEDDTTINRDRRVKLSYWYNEAKTLRNYESMDLPSIMRKCNQWHKESKNG